MDKFIYILLGMSVPVDILNGFCVLSNSEMDWLSSTFKLITLSTIFTISIYKKSILAHLFLALVFVMQLGEVYSNYLRNDNFRIESSNVIESIRICSPLLVYDYIVRTSRLNDKLNSLLAIFKSNYFFIALNFAIGLLGYGYTTYQGSVEFGGYGIKGYFYSGNELSALMICTYGWALICSANFRHKLLVHVSFFIMFLLLGTKTGIISWFILFLFDLYSTFIRYRISTRKALYSISVFCFLLFFVGNIELQFADALASSYASGGLMSVIFSSRDIFLIDAIEYLDDIGALGGFMSTLFGVGMTTMELSGKASVESDIVDIAIWYGFSGLLALLFVLFNMCSIFGNKSGFFLLSYVRVITIVLFSVALIVGHVYTSGLVAIPIACFYSYAFLRNLNHESTFNYKRAVSI